MKKRKLLFLIMFQMIILSSYGVIQLSSSMDSLFITLNKRNLSLFSLSWSNATCISDDKTNWNTGDSWQANMAIDIYGNIHVVWVDATDSASEWGTDDEIMYANYTAAGWSNATVISDDYTLWNDGSSITPCIATDKNGNLHVVWADTTDGEWENDYEIMYVNYTAGVWSNATCVSDFYGWNLGNSFRPQVIVGNNGYIHVVWHDETNGEWGDDDEIMYAINPGAGWSNASVISDDSNGWNNGTSRLPRIATDNIGNLHVVWQDETVGEWGNDKEIMYANYTAMGWSNATVISDDITGWNNDTSEFPRIAADNYGNLHVIWEDHTDGEWGTDIEIMYANYIAGSWSNATVISDDSTGWNNDESDYAEIAIDEDGNLHVVWEDSTDSVGEWGTDDVIMYTTNTTSGWSNVTCLSALYGWNTDDNTQPDIATYNNHLYVVWNEYSNGEWGSDREIMFSSKLSPSGRPFNTIPLILYIYSQISPLSSMVIIFSIILLIAVVAIGGTLIFLMHKKKR